MHIIVMIKLNKLILIFVVLLSMPCAIANGIEHRVLITFQFPENPEDNEIYWISAPDTSDIGMTKLYPVNDSAKYWSLELDGDKSIEDSIKGLVSNYNNMIALNNKNRRFFQTFSKTWGNPPRNTDYANVYICPITGEFMTDHVNGVEWMTCMNIAYDDPDWESDMVHQLIQTDLSGFKFKQYSSYRSQMVDCEPSVLSGTDNGSGDTVAKGDFWLISFYYSSELDNNNYYYVVESDVASVCGFKLIPVALDDEMPDWEDYEAVNNLKGFIGKEQFIQVYSKTRGLTDVAFEHVVIYAAPISGKFLIKHMYNGSNQLIYMPIDKYKPNDALWNSPSAEVIRFTDYSNFSPVLNNTIKK